MAHRAPSLSRYIIREAFHEKIRSKFNVYSLLYLSLKIETLRMLLKFSHDDESESSRRCCD